MHSSVIPLVIGVIKRHYYQCCRAGDFRDNTTVRKTDKKHPHQQPFRKLGTQCISRMHFNQLENGTFSVKYIPSHTGDDIGPTELSHLPLPNSVKEKIATKINLGIRKERIIDGKLQHYTFKLI